MLIPSAWIPRSIISLHNHWTVVRFKDLNQSSKATEIFRNTVHINLSTRRLKCLLWIRRRGWEMYNTTRQYEEYFEWKMSQNVPLQPLTWRWIRKTKRGGVYSGIWIRIQENWANRTLWRLQNPSIHSSWIAIAVSTMCLWVTLLSTSFFQYAHA